MTNITNYLKSQLNGKNSGMISFEIEGGDANAHKLLSYLKLPKEATSLRRC